MTQQQFAPKDAETLKTEITAELGLDYEGNEEMVDKIVNRELKGEEFKASLHADKVKHLSRKDFYKQQLVKAGLDPQTGEKIKPEAKATGGNENYSLSDIRALNDVHDDNVKKLVDYAKFLGVSVAEAKKTDEMQTYLNNENEKRKTAAASNTGKGKRGVQGGDIIEQAKRGEEVDFDALAEARIEEKRKKAGLK